MDERFAHRRDSAGNQINLQQLRDGRTSGHRHQREKRQRFFDPNLKCCTFLPTLPNFLVGRILLDDDAGTAQGRATVLKRIRAGLAVTPLGMGEPAVHALIYAEGAKAGFGHSKSLLCPHYLPEDAGKCGIWKNRNAVCVTWFCKHERGAQENIFGRHCNGF